jgi:hypothetical protein
MIFWGCYFDLFFFGVQILLTLSMGGGGTLNGMAHN